MEATTTPSMARRIRFGLLVLFLIGIPVQFYLAGRGVFGVSSYDAHKTGGGIMHIISFLVFLVSFFGADLRNGRDIGMGFGLFALTTLQAILGDFKHPDAGAFHPVNALLLLGLAVHLLMRDRPPRQRAQVSNTA
jgi:hypothetical protein